MNFDRLTEIQQLALLTPHLATGLSRFPVFGVCFCGYLLAWFPNSLGSSRAGGD